MSIIKAQQERTEQDKKSLDISHIRTYSHVMEPQQNSRPPEPRDVYDITKQIMDLVPDSEVELLYQLRKFHDTLWNQAPELRISGMLWKQLGNILNKNIDSFEQDWQKKILKLFNDE
jgi:hypothetical protein